MSEILLCVPKPTEPSRIGSGSCSQTSRSNAQLGCISPSKMTSHSRASWPSKQREDERFFCLEDGVLDWGPFWGLIAPGSRALASQVNGSESGTALGPDASLRQRDVGHGSRPENASKNVLPSGKGEPSERQYRPFHALMAFLGPSRSFRSLFSSHP